MSEDSRIHDAFGYITDVSNETHDGNDGVEVSPGTLTFFAQRYGVEEGFHNCVANNGVEVFKKAMIEMLMMGMPPTVIQLNAAATLANFAFLAGAEFATRHSLEHQEEGLRQAAADTMKELETLLQQPEEDS